MVYPKNFPGDAGIQIGIVASGGDPEGGDHPSDHSSNMKIVSPLEHGRNVNVEHLAFSPMMASPDGGTNRQFKGALPPGSLVYFLKTSGQSGGVILGQANDINNRGNRTPGNADLLGPWSYLSEIDTGVSMPGPIQETTERGAKVRKMQKSSGMFSVSQLDGLPTHGALFDITGFKTPEVKKIPTAKQKNDKMMTQQMMDQLPGTIMSLGKMFSSMKSKGPSSTGAGAGFGSQVDTLSSNNSVTFNEETYFESVYNSLPNQQMKKAVTSLSNLVQSLEVSGGVAFVTDGVVHEGIYLENARNLLGQVETIDDLMYVLKRLQWDTTLFGRDKLDIVETQIETAWGVVLQQVDVDGEITLSYANTEASLAEINAFSEMVSSNTAAPAFGSMPASPSTGSPSSGSGGGGGAGNILGQAQGMLGNMFGKSSGTIQEMMKRLHPEGEQTAKKLQQKVNQDSSHQKMKKISEATIKGQGDPTQKDYYDLF